MRRLVVLLTILWAGVAVFAQGTGTITGVVVSSWDGSNLPNVIVTVRGTTLATQSDQNGRYELKNVPAGDHVLRLSRPGFGAAVVTDVRVLAEQTTTVNGNLRPEFFEMEEYEVTAEEFTQETEKILFERQQAGALMDAIGSDQFSKLAAGDAGAIVARVTGVSVVGGKYAVVRGLSDRYTRTLMNGMEVPSADPYKLSPQLDLFPSAMIDRISVSKTFTPDQPGGTGGGTIDITTKSFPERPFVRFSTGMSYNENTSLQGKFLADPASSMNMYDIPKTPAFINDELFGLNDAPNRPQPLNARAGETMPEAIRRRNAANAVQDLMVELGAANFAGVEKTAPLNTSFTASAGETKRIWDRNVGVFIGGNYRREFRATDYMTVGRYSPEGVARIQGTEQRGNIYTDYGASVNIGIDLWEGSQLGYNLMMAHSTDEEARHGVFPTIEAPYDVLEQWQIHYTERQILNNQLSGHHEIPALSDSTFEWIIALANTTQDEPDQRFMNYYLSDNGTPTFGDASTPFPQYPSRYFRKINEDGINYRADYTLPLKFIPEESKLKFGIFNTRNERDFREQFFTYDLSSGFDPNNPNSYLNDPDYLRYVATRVTNIRTNYFFPRYVNDTAAHPYDASLDVQAFYSMAEVGIFPWLRVIGGARFERTDLELDAGQEGKADIDQTDVLPAASVVFTVRTNVNLRLSYGSTISRPSYRELAPVQSYLPDLSLTAVGDPNLEIASIKSYDFRVEWFPEPGDVISAGVFYKEVVGPIELISRDADDDNVTWINRFNSPAELMGVELEARKAMDFISDQLKGLTLGANVTLIKSSTDLTRAELINKRQTIPDAEDHRPLYDQSPYIINFDTTYEHPTSGTMVTVAANLTGERIVLTKVFGEDIYEHPPTSLDVAIAQKFWKHWTVRFTVRNILDSDYRRTYGSDYEGDIYDNHKRGRTYGLSLSADF